MANTVSKDRENNDQWDVCDKDDNEPHWSSKKCVKILVSTRRAV